MADTSKITLKQLKDAMNKAKNYTDNEIAGVTGVSKVEPEALDMPKVFFYGNALPTTKDNVNLTMEYISNTAKFRSFVKLKCQGTSSMSYAKKNFTVSMFSDESRNTKLKKDFKGWGPQSKFCLKANYVDTTHTRNLSGAKVAYDMVQSRPDSPFKQQLLQCPRNGAVDGFPIKLYFNGEFYGIYTWNIPKDGWMFNMDKSNPNHVVLCAERNTDGNSSLINSCQFRKLWTDGDGGDWSVEFGTYSTDMVASFNRCINFVMTATDQEFHDNIGEYFDLYSLLDYYCFSYLACHLDGLAKNMLMVTYDGVIWGACLYDMDSIYGVHWNGNSYVATNYQCPEQYQERFSGLWPRIERCFATELYARYRELRQGALSLSNIIKHVEEIYDVIPDRVFADEKAKWTGLPQVNTNTMTRFRNYMRDRAVYVDAQMEEIGTRVPCTGIVLSADTLSFTTTDIQTLSVVVSPDNCTDKVTWLVSPSRIVTVKNGVVTPIRNGEATITVTCGSYSDTCAVTVSGISESGGGSIGNYVTDNLYAYYDLTQLSTEATTVEDLSGNNNTFNVVSGTLTKDDLGGLIYSTNTNPIITNNSFNPQTAEASIEYTFKYTGVNNCNNPSNFTNRTCGINGDNGKGYYYWLGGYGYAIFKNNTNIISDRPIPSTLVNGEYYHVVCTFGDSEIKTYLNGELLGTHTHNATGIPSNTIYYLGNTTSSGTPTQVLYSSRFYNKVLTQEEITQNNTYEFTKLGLISGGDTGDYTDISYIESTGTQYINTRIVPTASTKIELVAEMSASEHYDHIFGSDNFMKVQWMNDIGTAIYATKKNNQNQISGLTLGKHTYVMDMTDTANVITIDGNKYGTNIGPVESTTNPLLLLSGYNNGTIETEFCGIGKIYSCKIYHEDTLVANMKPILTNGGTYGLLDTVNNTFYASEVGSFTGPVPSSGGETDTTLLEAVMGSFDSNFSEIASDIRARTAVIPLEITGDSFNFSCSSTTWEFAFKLSDNTGNVSGALNLVSNETLRPDATDAWGIPNFNYSTGWLNTKGGTVLVNSSYCKPSYVRMLIRKGPAGDTFSIHEIKDLEFSINGTSYKINKTAPTDNTVFSTAEYAITEPRTFNGTSDYIDTGIKLFDTAKTFTIFVDYATTTSTSNAQATIFHCLHELSPFRGLCLMEIANTGLYFIGGQAGGQNSYATDMPATGKYLISFVDGVINKIVTADNSGNLVHSATDIGANNPYVQISENLLIGCYQNTSGTKGRYWSGTINKFGVWYKQLTEAEINQVFGTNGENTNYLANASWQAGTLNNTGMTSSTDDKYTSVQIPTGRYILTSTNATWKKYRLSNSEGTVVAYNNGYNDTNDIIIDTSIYDDTIFTLEVSYYKPNDTIEAPSLTATTESNITTLTLDGSLSYAISDWPENPSGENGQVNAEYIISDINTVPSSYILKGYTRNNSLSSVSAKGLTKQYMVSLWNGKVYLSFTLDMAETGVTNDVESITNYLSNHPLTFKYVR